MVIRYSGKAGGVHESFGLNIEIRIKTSRHSGPATTNSPFSAGTDVPINLDIPTSLIVSPLFIPAAITSQKYGSPLKETGKRHVVYHILKGLGSTVAIRKGAIACSSIEI